MSERESSEISFERSVQDTIETMLREEHPYIKTEAMKQIAKRAANTVAEGVAEQYVYVVLATFGPSPLLTLVRSQQVACSKANVSFLFLSAELRNRIYDHLLIKRCHTKENVYEQRSIDILSENAVNIRQPPITRICKQMRRETLGIFYGGNKFEAMLYTLNFEANDAIQWLRAIGNTNARMIKQLRPFYYGPQSTMRVLKLFGDASGLAGSEVMSLSRVGSDKVKQLIQRNPDSQRRLVWMQCLAEEQHVHALLAQ